MQELSVTSQALKSVLYGDETFASALKGIFADQNNANLRHIVASLLGCELRHHLLFEKLISIIPIEYSEDEKCLIFIALSNNLFIKKLDVNNVNNFLKEQFGVEKFNAVANYLEYQGSPIELIPEDIPHDSIEFISLRFNTPLWLVKMWQKHFGKGLTFKLLKKNSKPQNFTVRVNTFETNSNDVISENSDFTISDIDNMLIYNGKFPNHRNKFFRSFGVFPETLSLKVMVDSINQTNVNNLLIYLDADDSLFYELYLKYQDHANYNLAVHDLEKHFDLEHSVKSNNYIHNVNIFNANDASSMEASISNQQDLVVVFPQSSNFDNIRIYPDYLLKFKQENLDNIINAQRNALEGSSEYVVEDGMLIYLNTTVDRKEGHSLIMNFLQKHHDFELIEEHQRFPFDKYDSCLYYAIIKRVGESHSD